MAVYYKTLGFVLKSEDRGEADQLFTVFTEKFGKIKILARSIRKIKSKLRSNFQLFSLCEIEFIQGKGYKTLTDAAVINDFREINKDLEKLKTIHQINEALDNLVKGQVPDEKIWRLLKEILDKLNERDKTEIIYYHFFWQILKVLGYKPELYFCILCHNKLKSEELYFSSIDGGIICKECFKKNQDLIQILPDTIKVLRLTLKNSSKKIKINESVFKNLKEVSDKFLSHILVQTS